MTNNKEPLNLGRMILVNAGGRLITGAIAIGLLVLLALIAGVFGNDNESRNAGAQPNSTKSIVPVPSETTTTSSNVDAPEENTDYTSEQRDNVIKKAYDNHVTMGKSEDDLWKLAEDTCHAGYIGTLSTIVLTDTKDFQKVAVHELCPQYDINMEYY